MTMRSLKQHQRLQAQSLRVLSATLFLIVWLVPRGIAAQQPSTAEQFWPEINVYIHLKPKVRLFLLGTVSKAVEDGELRHSQAFESQFGAHVDYIPSKHFILRTGYRYGTSIGDTDDPYKEHRFLTEQTLRKMLPGDLLLSDRNRQDFRFVDGDFSFRYRNRVTIEREFHVLRKRSVTPYASGEIFYDTRSRAWNRNRWAVGVQTSLRPRALLKMLLPKRQIILDIYYMRQNDSRSEPQHINALGAVLGFYF